MFFLKIFLVAALVRMAVLYDVFQEQPWILAVVYASGGAAVDTLLPYDWTERLLRTWAAFLLAWLYFWLLAKLAEAGPFWWLVMLAGLPIILL